MRRFLSIVSLVGLLLAGGVAVVWIRSYRGTPGDEVIWHAGGVRYTLRSENGVVALRRPPPVDLPAAEAARLLGRLSNDDLDWCVSARWNSPTHLVISPARPLPFRGASDGAFRELQKRPRAGFGLMLRALEDPRKTIAAHYALIRLAWPNGFGPITGSTVTDPMVTTLCWLRVEVPRPPMPDRPVPLGPDRIPFVHVPGKPNPNGSVGASFEVPVAGSATRFDPAQIPAILRRWHDLVDEEAVSARHGVLVAPLSTPAGVWLVAWLLTRHRRRRFARLGAGLCVHCGYDLRASTGVCPECGETIAGAIAAAAPDVRGASARVP